MDKKNSSAEQKLNDMYTIMDLESRISCMKFSKEIKELMELTWDFFDKIMNSYFLTNMYYLADDVSKLEEVLLNLLSWKRIIIYVEIFQTDMSLINTCCIPVNSVQQLFEIAEEFDYWYDNPLYSYELHMSAEKNFTFK